MIPILSWEWVAIVSSRPGRQSLQNKNCLPAGLKTGAEACVRRRQLLKLSITSSFRFRYCANTKTAPNNEKPPDFPGFLSERYWDRTSNLFQNAKNGAQRLSLSISIGIVPLGVSLTASQWGSRRRESSQSAGAHKLRGCALSFGKLGGKLRETAGVRVSQSFKDCIDSDCNFPMGSTEFLIDRF